MQTEQRIELVTTRTRIDEIEPEWRKLWKRAGATPFQSPAWLLPWFSSFASGARSRVLCLWEGGRLAGCAALVEREGPGGARLTLAGAGVSDYLDILHDPSHGAAGVRGLLNALGECATASGGFEAEDVPASSPLCARAAEIGGSSALTACPVVTLSEGFDEHVARLPTWLRRNLGQGMRRLTRLGEPRWHVADDRDVAELLEALFRLHRARWERKEGKPGVLADPSVQAFHRSSAPKLLALGALRLQALALGDRIVGVIYVLVGPRAYQYISGFDPELAEHGLGNLLVARAMSDAFATGRREYDFLRGAEKYKYAWGAHDEWTFHVRIPASPQGRGETRTGA